MKALRIVALNAAIVTLCANSAFAQRNKAKLKMAAVLPLSGPMSPYGQEVLNGIESGLDYLKVSDPDLAERLLLISKDSQSSTEIAKEISEKLLKSRQADLLFGSVTSSSTLSIFSAVERFNKPLVAIAATNRRITKISKNTYRTCFVDSFQGRALAKFVVQTLKKKRVAILFEETSAYSKSIATAFESEIQRQGAKVVLTKTYNTGDKNFKSQLKAIKRKRPHAILVPGYYREAGIIINQAKEVGLRVPLLGGDGWDSPKLYDITKKAALKGHYYASHFSPNDPDPTVQDFVAKYRQKFQKTPGMLAAMGFDAIMVTADAFKRARTNLTTQLNRAFKSATNVKGVMGLISLNQHRNAIKPVSILATTVDGSKFSHKVDFNAAAE